MPKRLSSYLHIFVLLIDVKTLAALKANGLYLEKSL